MSFASSPLGKIANILKANPNVKSVDVYDSHQRIVAVVNAPEGMTGVNIVTIDVSMSFDDVGLPKYSAEVSTRAAASTCDVEVYRVDDSNGDEAVKALVSDVVGADVDALSRAVTIMNEPIPDRWPKVCLTSDISIGDDWYTVERFPLPSANSIHMALYGAPIDPSTSEATSQTLFARLNKKYDETYANHSTCGGALEAAVDVTSWKRLGGKAEASCYGAWEEREAPGKNRRPSTNASRLARMRDTGRLPTECQLAVMKFISSFRATNGVSPTMREIANHMEVTSINTVDGYLKSLATKRLIRRIANKARSTVLTRDGVWVMKYSQTA